MSARGTRRSAGIGVLVLCFLAACGKVPSIDEVKQSMETAAADPAKTDAAVPADPAPQGGPSPAADPAAAGQTTEGGTETKPAPPQGTPEAAPTNPAPAQPAGKPQSRAPEVVLKSIALGSSDPEGGGVIGDEGGYLGLIDELLPNEEKVTEIVFNAPTTLYFGDAACVAVSKLKHLRKIEIHSQGVNRITPAGLKELAFLPVLEELALTGFPFTSEHLEALCHFPSLKSLSLYNASGLDETIAKLSEIPTLTRLDLGVVPNADVAIRVLNSCKGLKFLGLAQTAISDEGLNYLKSYPALEELDLRGCKSFTGAGLLWVRSGRGIRVLRVDESTFGRDGYLAIMNSPGLQEFYGSKTGCTDEYLQAFKGCGNLRVLSLPNCTGIAGDALRLLQIKNLQELNLQNTGVGDKQLAILQRFTALKKLNLGGTAVTDAGYQALRRRLPKCEIVK